VFYSTISGKPSVVSATHLYFPRHFDCAGSGWPIGSTAQGPDQTHSDVRRLTPLSQSGAISAPIAGTYRFSEIAEAVAVAAKKSWQGAVHGG